MSQGEVVYQLLCLVNSLLWVGPVQSPAWEVGGSPDGGGFQSIKTHEGLQVHSLDQVIEFTALCTARTVDKMIQMLALESIHPSPGWSPAQLTPSSASSLILIHSAFGQFSILCMNAGVSR